MNIDTITLQEEETRSPGLSADEQVKRLRQLAATWLQENRYQKAIEIYEKALVVAEATSPVLQETAAEICHELGKLHFDQGHRREASKHYKKALTFYETIHPSKRHKDVASSYFIMGRFFEQIWKVDLARQHYGESHRLMGIVLGEDHPHVKAIGMQLERFEKNVAPFAK